MYCGKCGTNLGENYNSSFCSECGNDLREKTDEVMETPEIPSEENSMRLKFGAFMKHPLNSALKRDIVSCAIVLYICSGLTFVVGLMGGNLFVIIDILMLVGLGLGIQLAYSRACSIVALCYAVFNVIVAIITTGRPSGYLIVIAGGYAVFSTYKARKAYNTYIETNVIEDNSLEKIKKIKEAQKAARKSKKV